MVRLPRPLLPLSLAFTLAALSSEAGAVGRVIAPSASSIQVTRTELAHSQAGSRTTTFFRVEVSGTATHFGVVLPALAGSRLDPASNAFFEALDESTAPRIVPPPATLSCGSTTSTSVQSLVLPTWIPTTFPSGVVVVKDLDELESAALARGLIVTTVDRDALTNAAPSSGFVLLEYGKPQPKMRTEAVRMVTPAINHALRWSLPVSATAMDVVVYAFDRQRQRTSGTELEPSDLMATWNVFAGSSDYEQMRQSALDGKDSYVVEASGGSPLFQWSLLPWGAGTIAPAVHSYFSRAYLAGQTPKKADDCLNAVWAARDAGKQGATLTHYCAAGSLAAMAGAAPACDTTAGAGQVLADSIGCGSADDLAAALSGENLYDVRVTRLFARVTAQTAAKVLEPGVSATVSPITPASAANTSGCTSGSGGSGGGNGGGTGAGGLPPNTGAGPGGYIPGQPEPYEPVYVDEGHTDVGIYCGGSSENDSACSGDSSSSSNDSGCSGDSTDSSSSDGSCSGDSSDSSSDGSCSGDSSSGSDGGGCSGDSSGGSGCSGDSSGGDCRLGGPRRRPRASILGMALALCAFVLRRRRRPRVRR
ncbi:MAG: DUF2330 domain-containing protein [Polyangiaceae bacterium]